MNTKKPKTLLDDQRFARLWNALLTAEQVAYVLDCPVDTVRHRASTLRLQGVPLKSMRKDGLDPGDLANLARRTLPTPSGDPTDPTPREFVLLWQLCDNVTAIAQITGMNEPAIRSRAKTYRNFGVPLRPRTRGVQPKANPIKPAQS